MLLKRLRLGMLPMLEQLQREYGDFVRFAVGQRPFYLVSDPSAIREVLVTRAEHFTKSPILRSANLVLGQGLLLSEGDLHRRQRKLIQPAFHAQRVASYAREIVDITLRRTGCWRAGQAIDTAAEMTQLTLQIIARILFDAELEEEVGELSEAMGVTVTMFDRARSPWRWLLDRLPLASNRRFFAAVERLHMTIDRLICQRLAGGSDRNDLLSLLLNARDESGQGMSPQLVRDEAITLFAAGHETTANAMVWTWYLLAGHPEMEAQLHAELDRVLPDRPPTAADLPELRFARAVMAESMRLYPPAWVVARECVSEVEIGGYRLPAGSIVLMSQWIVQRHPRWWPDPLRFHPQRWLETSRDERPRYAYFPFGGGARQCIGEPLAWMESTLLLSTIARNWRLHRANDAPVELHPTITLRPRDPLLMRLERR